MVNKTQTTTEANGSNASAQIQPEGEEETEKDKIRIEDLFDKDELSNCNKGYKTICPDCGLQGGRSEGFTLFTDTNTAHCQTSGKWFRLLEVYALKKKIIKCLDGRETGDSNTKILGGEAYTLTLDEFKEEFGTDKFNKLAKQLRIKKRVELPGPGRYISEFADDLGDVYKSRNILFFRNELRKVIEIHRYKVTNDSGEEWIENGFKEVEGNRFVTLAEMLIKPWRTVLTKGGTEKTINISMTQSMANIVLASPNFQKAIPPIKRIFDIPIPIIYKGKLTFPKKGYDSRFQSWLPYTAPQIQKELFTVEQARDVIDSIFAEFCFESEKDRTHAIAAFITPFLRGLFPKFSTRTPVFVYMANRERAGKDYCAGCTGMLYEGSNTEDPAISSGEKGSGNSNEELRKKVTACMMQGKKRFHSANNKGLLDNSIFEGITTSESWNDRILGKNENIKFDNEMDYSLSGNLGIRLTPDLANRARVINLVLVDEDANARTFKNPRLHEWIFENRGTIISAIYTLVKNWIDQGKPNGSLPFTSFPHWANICGGIMECAGYENPCKPDKVTIMSLDPETEEMKQLFECCYAKAPNKWLTKKEIQDLISDEDIMSDMDLTNHGDQTKFGMKIDRYVKRILGGITMYDDGNSRAARRRYRFVIDDIQSKVAGLASIGRAPISGELVDPNKGIVIATERQTVPNIANPAKSVSVLDEMSKKYNDAIKAKEKKSRTPKPKSDRELQFWEDPQCADIVVQCTKEQVLNWIKANPGVDYEIFYKSLGIGSYAHLDTLLNEKLIKPKDNGWEAIQ